MMGHRIGVRVVVLLTGLVSGCGYTIIKKDTFRNHRLPADSARIVSLETQLASLRAQRTADSVRYAMLVKEAQSGPPQSSAVANADSLLRARELEIQTLRDQLAKLTAEMERIKRRLANPRS